MIHMNHTLTRMLGVCGWGDWSEIEKIGKYRRSLYRRFKSKLLETSSGMRSIQRREPSLMM